MKAMQSFTSRMVSGFFNLQIIALYLYIKIVAVCHQSSLTFQFLHLINQNVYWRSFFFKLLKIVLLKIVDCLRIFYALRIPVYSHDHQRGNGCGNRDHGSKGRQLARDLTEKAWEPRVLYVHVNYCLRHSEQSLYNICNRHVNYKVVERDLGCNNNNNNNNNNDDLITYIAYFT